MANKYFSNERIFNAKDVAQSTLSLPNDLTLAAASWVPSFIRFGQYGTVYIPLNMAGNIFVKSAGLFCNFADGLVFKNVAESFNIQFQYLGLSDATIPPLVLTGTTVLVQGANTLAGAGTAYLTELSVGDFIMTPAGNLYIVKTVPSDIAATIFQYAFNDETCIGNIKKITGSGGAILQYQIRDLRMLNMLFKAEKFVPVVSLSTALQYIACQVNVTLNSPNLTFLTKSIDTAFDGDPVFFDVMSEIEFTPRPIEG